MAFNRMMAACLLILIGCGPTSQPAAAEPKPEDILQASIRNLQSEDPVARGVAISYLSSLDNAREYLPEIKKLEKDNDATVRSAAQEAVKRIQTKNK